MRPDFGSGLYGLVFEPGGPGARGDDAAPRAGRAAAVARPPDRASSRSRSTQDEGDAHRQRRATSCSQTQQRGDDVVLEERRRELRVLRRPSPARRSRRPASSTGSNTSRSPTPRRPTPHCASARCTCACCGRAGLTAETQRRDQRRRAHPARSPRRRRRPPSCRRCWRASTTRRRSCSSRTDSTGDFSTYTLRLVAGAGSESPPAGFDPLLASVEFSFKVECPIDFDCAAACDVRARAGRAAGDRLPREGLRLLPAADARPAQPDRARAGPSASRPTPGSRSSSCSRTSRTSCRYRQDAVATEAYLGTARRRTSLRRHARLVDYRVHEGANARAWVRMFVERRGCGARRRARRCSRASPDIPDGIEPGGPRAPGGARRGRRDVRDAARTRCSTRPTSASTSGRGATPAAACRAARPPRRSLGDHPAAEGGRRAGPGRGGRARSPGAPEDADPAKRAAVRLTSVRAVASTRPAACSPTRRRTRSVAVTEIDVGRRGRAAVPAVHLGRRAPGPRRRRGVGEHRARRPRPDDRRRSPRATCRRPSSPRSPPDGCDPCTHAGPDAGADPVPADARERPGDAGAAGAAAGVRARPAGGLALEADLDSLTFSPAAPRLARTSAASTSPPHPRSCAAATTSGRSATARTVAVLVAAGAQR